MSRSAKKVLPVCNRQFRSAVCRSRREEAHSSAGKVRLVTSSPTMKHADMAIRAPLASPAPDCRLQTGSTLCCAVP